MSLVLAIETSCDETAVAVAVDTGIIVASEVASQIALHAPHGGVVPELASRSHNARLRPLIEETLSGAGLSLRDLAAVAATSGPGLASSLLVGDTTAKALALGLGLPFHSINHMEGHLLSPFIPREAGDSGDIRPNLSLVVSGGHTLLVLVHGTGRYEVLGSTVDDAAGEAFDKVGKMLGLPYPGGPEIDRRTPLGDPEAFAFPRSMLDRDCHDFSFSGLKTAVRIQLEKLPASPGETLLADLCASFQAAVVEVLVTKLDRAAREHGCGLLTVSGGVSCNAGLRRAVQDMAERTGRELLLAAPEHSTDNAAMIAFAAVARRAAGIPPSPLDADIDPNLTLTPDP